MSYILIAIISHLTTGVANVMDKVVVSKYLKSPEIYAFYVGILTAVVIVLIPFGVVWPGLYLLTLSLIFGAFFVAGFFLMNAGLLNGETSRVITVLGGSLPIFSLILSYIFLNERLSTFQYSAVALLVAGIFAMGIEFKSSNSLTKGHYLKYSLAAGLCFAITFVGSKYIFNHQPFISGFFWMRVGGFLAGLSLLLYPTWRRNIINDLKLPVAEQKTSKGLVLINQIIGAAGFVLLNIAISKGSATLVNALQGVQYAFIFFLALILSKKIPQLKEELSTKIIIQKIIAIILIGAGLAMLSI